MNALSVSGVVALRYSFYAFSAVTHRVYRLAVY